MMVFDRTEQDVLSAINIRTNEIQQGFALSDEQIAIMERGMLTVNVLNRIENKQKELYEDFIEMGYYCNPIVNKTWEIGGHFTDVEFQRLLDNLAVLRDAFFVYSTTPSNPTAVYHYEQINALERILHDLDSEVDVVVDNYRECGDVECGEE